MSIKQQIASQLEKVLEDLGIEDALPVVDYPADPKNGDYATNVAMVAFKKNQESLQFGGQAGIRNHGYKSPLDLAKVIADKFSTLNSQFSTQVAPPGFINFWVKDEVFLQSLSSESEQILKGKKIVVEYTDPNPFKELHIGHLYSNIIGESLCLLFEANGAIVWRADYFGDVGMHVAKAIWGLRSKLKVQSSKFKVMADLEKESLDERIKFLGEGYAFGSNEYAEKDEVKEEVKHLNKLIYIAAQKMWKKEKGIKPQVEYRKGEKIDEKELDQVYELYATGRKWSLEYFETLYKRLGTKFDGYYPESIAGEKGYKLVRDNIQRGVFEESQGAVIFPGEKQGLHNRVFINKLGLPTYEAKELGLAPWKYEEFAYDKSYIVTANEIKEYFNVLISAMKQINPELGEKTKHVGHGMVRLPEGKMSSRSGNVITVQSLFDLAKENIIKTHPDIKEEVAEMVGVGAIKYAFLKSGVGKDMTFDFDESVSFDGNSGPYIQYTFARTQSVLAKAGISNFSHRDKQFQISNFKLEAEERDLLRLLARFPEVVAEAAERLAPNMLCTYLFELSQSFNLFYQKHSILRPEGLGGFEGKEGLDVVRNFRLGLTRATGETIKKGLYLLGIKAPEKM